MQEAHLSGWMLLHFTPISTTKSLLTTIPTPTRLSMTILMGMPYRKVSP